MSLLLDEHQPKTLDEAINLLVSNLSTSERLYIIENGADGLHFGPGMAIRNAWLWDNPKEGRVRVLAQHFRDELGLGHADDMSGMIMKGVVAKVRAEAFDKGKQAEYYRNFWREQGIDPLTQEKIVAADKSAITVIREFFSSITTTEADHD